MTFKILSSSQARLLKNFKDAVRSLTYIPSLIFSSKSPSIVNAGGTTKRLIKYSSKQYRVTISFADDKRIKHATRYCIEQVEAQTKRSEDRKRTAESFACTTIQRRYWERRGISRFSSPSRDANVPTNFIVRFITPTRFSFVTFLKALESSFITAFWLSQ